MADNKNYGRGQNPRSAAKRFKPGASANPTGRPKGSKNRNTIIREVLDQLVVGDLDGKRKKVSVTKASLLRLSQMALKGNISAIKEVLALWKESEDAIAAERQAQYPFSDADRNVIESIYARMNATEELVRP